MDFPDSSVPVKYTLVAVRQKAIGLWDKLDGFKDRFIVDPAIDMRIKQGLVFLPILIVRIWFVITDATAHDKSALAASITIRLQDQKRHLAQGNK